MMKSILRARSNTASYYADNIKSSLHGKTSHRRGRSFGSISSRLRMGETTTKTVNGSSEYTPLALLQVTTNDGTSSETASEDDASAEVQPKSMPTANNTLLDNADEDLLSFNPSDDTYDVVMSLPLSESMKETEKTFQPTLASPDEDLKQALSLQISINVEDVKIIEEEPEPEPEPEHTILHHKPLSRVELGDINLTDDDSLSHGSFEVARETISENFVAAEVSRIQTKLEEVVEDTLTGMSDIVLSCGLCLDDDEEMLEEDDDHTADTVGSSVESSYVESTLYQSTLCETEKDGNESAASSTTSSFVVDYTPKEGVVLRQQEETTTPQSNDEDLLSICTEQGDDVVSMRSSARHAGMETTTCSKREEELQMLKADVLRHHDLGSILSEYSV